MLHKKLCCTCNIFCLTKLSKVTEYPHINCILCMHISFHHSNHWQMDSKLENENVEDGIIGRATQVCLWAKWWCFLPGYFHSWVLKFGAILQRLLPGLPSTTTRILPQSNQVTPNHHHLKVDSKCHWQWAKCCCRYCFEKCRSSHLLAPYEFMVPMMKAINFMHAQYTTNQLKHG